MTMRLDGEVIRLEGDCHVEQAEQLVVWLQQAPGRSVDISACRHLHSAVVQVLLSFAPRVAGTPSDPFLREFVAPNFHPLGGAIEG